MTIFDMKFYGVASTFLASKPEIQISLNEQDIVEKPNRSNTCFVATVLRKFEGHDYIVKVETKNGEYECISMFEPELCYDVPISRWCGCQRSEIPEKIMECYIRHLNG